MTSTKSNELLRELQRWLIWEWEDKYEDAEYDRLHDSTWEFFSDKVLRVAAAKICAHLGHEPVMDQCCIPEHDFCIYCQELTPGQAKR